MKVILPNFDTEDCIDIAQLTKEHFVLALKDGKPFGVLCTDPNNVDYWIQTSMWEDYFSHRTFSTIYEAIEDFAGQYSGITFEAYHE